MTTSRFRNPKPLKKVRFAGALPPEAFSPNFRFKSLHSLDTQLTLKIDSTSPTDFTCIHWFSCVCFRLSGESDRLFMQGEFEFDKWPIYSVEIEHSDFAKWLHKESLELRNIADLKHFLVVSVDDVLEVLAYEDPIFEQGSIDLNKTALENSANPSELRDLVYARSVGQTEGKFELLLELILDEIKNKFSGQNTSLIGHVVDIRNLETLMRTYQHIRQARTHGEVLEFLDKELK